MSGRIVVQIEVEIKSSSYLEKNDIMKLTQEYLEKCHSVLINGEISLLHAPSTIKSNIEHIIISFETRIQRVSFWQADIYYTIYKLLDQEPEKDFLDGEEDTAAFEQWELPNKHLQGIWNSIVVDKDLKRKLIGYCDSSIRFAEASIDPSIISWNRMCLLYGPPGTGKTSLCKALAQQSFIRHSERFSSGVLLEINSHSLFSKYFSESGKLVMKMFDHVQELADDPGCFVFILIDEVESIASARQASHTAQEPGDAVRVVNAVLTSLDSLKRRPNVLVLCTSNMLGSIDPAFCDRLDLQLYMGPPPESARFEILRSCVLELMDKRVIHDRLRTQFEGAVVVTQHSQSELNKLSNCRNESASRNPIGLLWRVAAVTEGMSGRLLRRLPLKAFSQCFVRGSICAVQLGVKYDPTTKEAAHTVHSVQTSTHSPAGTSTPRVTPESPPLSLTMFLLALEQVARDEKQIEGATPLDPSEDLQPKYFSQDPNQSLGGQYESTNSETEELSNDSHGNSEEVSSAGYAGGEGTKDDDEITVDGDDNEEAITPWNMIVN